MLLDETQAVPTAPADDTTEEKAPESAEAEGTESEETVA